MDPFDDSAVAPRPIRALSRAAQQQVLDALVAILPGERDWPHVVRTLRLDDGDLAPLLRQLVRRADAAQARAHRAVFLRAFGVAQ